jgi:hypothetical protein
MGCLSSADTLLDGLKSAASAIKSDVDGALSDIRGLDPKKFASRKEYEEAKAEAAVAHKAKLASYKNAIKDYNLGATALSALSGLKMELMADLQGGAYLALLDLIPGAPGNLAAIATAVAAIKEMQC